MAGFKLNSKYLWDDRRVVDDQKILEDPKITQANTVIILYEIRNAVLLYDEMMMVVTPRDKYFSNFCCCFVAFFKSVLTSCATKKGR